MVATNIAFANESMLIHWNMNFFVIIFYDSISISQETLCLYYKG
jgi:hypothetical protein